MKELLKAIQADRLTKVTAERFETIDRLVPEVNLLEGDIVECGIWKGGMAIYLAKTFPTRTIWLADSFEGFQHPDTGKYYFKGESHKAGGMATPLEGVQQALAKYEVDVTRINLLEGFVKDTLPQAKIDKIALLRVDVDAYSATREVLDELYPKVVAGGYIVFDDTCLTETRAAILDFFDANEEGVNLYHTTTGEVVTLLKSNQALPCGCYIKKL